MCCGCSCPARCARRKPSPEQIVAEALTGLLAMMVLAFLRIPIAISMGIVGIVGYAYMRDWNWAVAFATAQTKIYETGRNYTLSVIPLFILMGNFVTRAGMSQELFRTAYAFIGHLRGGLAMATILGCAGFGAICGSSIATAATFAKVAYPSMKKFGYADYLATGSIAAGGTLGILIPPSTIMVIYGIMTETNIGKLFAAGILPGVLATVLLCLTVQYITWRDPRAGPPGERMSWRERFATLEGLWAFAAVGMVVIGVAKLGWLDADDAAVIGAFIVFGLALVYKGVTSVIALFTLVMGGIYGGVFTAMPGELRDLVKRFELHPILVVAAIMTIYVILGTAMEELSMILLTVPVFFPLVVHLGLDPVWFGILIVVVVEIGLISPPVGM